MSERGTKSRPRQRRESNWTGKDFKEYVKEQLKKVDDDEIVSINRGTGKALMKDIRKKGRNQTKPKYVSMGRGTKRVKVN